MLGGGGLNSTTEDYVRFAEMLLNEGEYRGNRIINKATLDLMREKKIKDIVSREYFFYGNRGDWGLWISLYSQLLKTRMGLITLDGEELPGPILLLIENDFYMIYMEQKRGGPRAPFNANVATQMVYEAMAN